MWWKLRRQYTILFTLRRGGSTIRADIEELKLLITHNLDVVEFLDILEIDMYELCNILEEQIEEAYTRLHNACR